jgi:excisionase family DNA binding protein
MIENDLDVVLLPASHVAKLLKVSTRTLWRLVAAGKLVRPIKIGRSVRWRKDELMQWISAGCPPVAQT